LPKYILFLELVITKITSYLLKFILYPLFWNIVFANLRYVEIPIEHKMKTHRHNSECHSNES